MAPHQITKRIKTSAPRTIADEVAALTLESAIYIGTGTRSCITGNDRVQYLDGPTLHCDTAALSESHQPARPTNSVIARQTTSPRPTSDGLVGSDRVVRQKN